MLTPLEDLAVQCLRKQIDGIFISKNGKKRFKIHSIEDGRWVFLEEKTEMIYYLSEIEPYIGSFEQIPDIPTTWEEFCKNYKGDGYWITTDSNICGFGFKKEDKNNLDIKRCKNVVPTEELAIAFLAMMQLISLRNAWIKGWKHTNPLQNHWCIVRHNDDYIGVSSLLISHPLEFPTEKMAKEFLKCFGYLIEQAKPLL